MSSRSITETHYRVSLTTSLKITINQLPGHTSGLQSLSHQDHFGGDKAPFQLSPKFSLSLTSRLPNAKCLHCPGSHAGLSPQLLAPDTFPARTHDPFPFNPFPPKAGISLGTQQCHGEHRTTFNPRLSPIPGSLNPTQLQQGVPRLPHSAESLQFSFTAPMPNSA